MKPKVTLPWNAAAWRQNTYAPRVTHVPDPVGERPAIEVPMYGYAAEGDTRPREMTCGGNVMQATLDAVAKQLIAQMQMNGQPGTYNFPIVTELERGK